MVDHEPLAFFMSTTLYRNNEQYSSANFISGVRSDEPADEKVKWYPSAACEWTPEISASLLKFFMDSRYPFREFDEIPFEEPLRSEVRRFFISLDAYLESPNPVLSAKYLLAEACTQDFASRLKKIKRKSFEKSWGVKHFALPDWWDNTPSFKINDIGDIFNYSYLIHWKTEDEDDYLNGLIDVSNDVDLRPFKRLLTEILPDSEIPKIEEMDILSKISSSRCFDQNRKKKCSHFELKPDRLYFNKRRGLSVRSVIDVGPANKRDSILVDPADLNTINLLDAQLGEVLSRMEGHIHLRDSERVDQRLKSLARNYEYFIQRDLKKEGITKPFYLAKAVIEAVDEKYPYLNIGQYKDFYSDYRVLVGDEIISMKRGHGLGMANAITTLMNLAVHELVSEEAMYDKGAFKSECLALNDDFVAAFESEEDAEEYWDAEDRIMNQLGLLRSEEKSFLSCIRFTIAERYFFEETENPKNSYILRELYLPLAAPNIALAKDAFAATQVNVSHEKATDILREIVRYWGYEFFPKESNYPYLFGGWYNPHFKGVDLSLVYLEDLPYNSNVASAVHAANVKYKFRGKGEEYIPPILKLSAFPHFPDEYKQRLLNVPIDEIKLRFYYCKNRESFKIYARSYLNARKKKYKEMIPLPYYDALKFVIKNNEERSFYPNQDMISGYAMFDLINLPVSDPYLDPNPYLAMISKFNSIAYEFKEEYSFICKGNDALRRKDLAISADMKWSYWNNLISYKFDEVDSFITIPRDYDPQNYYLEPVKIGLVASTLYMQSGYPILKPDFVSPFLEKKREVFGRLLSIPELLICTTYKIERKMIKAIVELNMEINEENVSLIKELIKRYDTENPASLLEPTDVLIEVSISKLMDNPNLILQLYINDQIDGLYDDETTSMLKAFKSLLLRLEYKSSMDFDSYHEFRESIYDHINDPMQRFIFKNSKILEYFDERHKKSTLDESLQVDSFPNTDLSSEDESYITESSFSDSEEDDDY